MDSGEVRQPGRRVTAASANAALLTQKKEWASSIPSPNQMLKPKPTQTLRRSTVVDMKLNTAISDVKGPECPTWCVSTHDSIEDPETCWSEDKTVALEAVAEHRGPFEEGPLLHVYLEQEPSILARLMLHPDTPAPMTVHQARQLITHLKHLIALAEAE